MHCVTWTPTEPEHSPVAWQAPDGLSRPNHAVLTAAGVIGIVLVGQRGALLTTKGRRDLYPNEPITLSGTGACLLWHPVPELHQRLGPEPTRGDDDKRCSEVFHLEIDGASHPLRPDALLLVGRHPRCDVVLADPRVSSLHCALACREAGVEVVDLDSRNGTRVDGTRIQAATVTRRTALRLGPITAALNPETSPNRDLLRLPSRAMKNLYAQVERVAPSPAPVLIEGESGTGKEGIARSLHQLSGRGGRFVTINASLLTPELAASELFGHVRGAFTGAGRDRPGAFVLADNGTLFLDEVGELRLDVQAELLRVIEENVVRPLGGTDPVPVNVRLVTATHRDLAADVRQGTFRHDLYHRIWVLPLSLAPLRRRGEDIDALADGILCRQTPPRRLTSAARNKLHTHTWPGNIRELVNVLKRACVMTEAQTLAPEHLHVLPALGAPATLDHVLRQSVVATYAKHGGSVAATARELGIHRATVYRHLRQARNERTRHP